MRLAAMLLLAVVGCDDQDLIHTPPASRPDAGGTPNGAKEEEVDGGGGCRIAADCDDSNDCTVDECLENGECQNTFPCGDRICDRVCGEDQDNCPADCGSCCQTHLLGQCRDREIEQCVCAERASCCTDVWDQECVNLVDTAKCGACDCCTAHPEPGCADPVVSECVCDFDSDCCSIEWSEGCVAVVSSQDCGTCP